MGKTFDGRTPPTPLGVIWVAVNDRGLVAISLQDDEEACCTELTARHRAQIIPHESRTQPATSQIAAYLTGERTDFDLPIDWKVMRPFQESVLRATIDIPRGATRTYGEIAVQVGNRRAAQAVGRAEATNPIPLVIPCHRVLASNGGLHGSSGYGGLDTKAWLLRLEGVCF